MSGRLDDRAVVHTCCGSGAATERLRGGLVAEARSSVTVSPEKGRRFMLPCPSLSGRGGGVWAMQHWLLVNSPLNVAPPRALSLPAQALLCFLLACSQWLPAALPRL